MGKQLDKIQELIERREKARLGGGEKAIAKQHEKGKFTARERINMLLDEGRRPMTATALLPVSVPLAAAWFTSLLRMPPSLAVRWVRPWH